MGLFDIFKNWAHGRRKSREKKAIDHLRVELEAEMKRYRKLDAVVREIEKEVDKGNIDEARKFVPNLVRLMKEKKILDKAERLDFRKFRRTLLKDLKDQLRGVK